MKFCKSDLYRTSILHYWVTTDIYMHFMCLKMIFVVFILGGKTDNIDAMQYNDD